MKDVKGCLPLIGLLGSSSVGSKVSNDVLPSPPCRASIFPCLEPSASLPSVSLLASLSALSNFLFSFFTSSGSSSEANRPDFGVVCFSLIT